MTQITRWRFNTDPALSGSFAVSAPHLKLKNVAVVGPTIDYTATLDVAGAATLTGTESTVAVGLPITHDFETLDVNAQEPLRQKQKLITNVKFLIDESKTLFAGNDFNNLFPTTIDTADDYNAATGVMSGIGEVVIQGQWSRNGRVCVRHSAPRAMSILAVIPEVTLGS